MFKALPLPEVQNRRRPSANIVQIPKLLVQPKFGVQQHFRGDRAAGLPLDFACRRVRRIAQSLPWHLLHVLVGRGPLCEGGTAKACQAWSLMFDKRHPPREQILNCLAECTCQIYYECGNLKFKTVKDLGKTFWYVKNIALTLVRIPVVTM